MSRILTRRSITRASSFFPPTQPSSGAALTNYGKPLASRLPSILGKHCSTVVTNHGRPFASRLHAILHRYYSPPTILAKNRTAQRTVYSRSIPFMITKPKLYKNYHTKTNFSPTPSNPVTHHSQVAWRRVSLPHKCTSIGIIARAVTLAVTRSHLTPTLVAFIIGEAAWAQKNLVKAEALQTRDSLYMRAQDGRAYFTSFIFSLLEGVILLLRAVYLSILFMPAITMAPFADCFGSHFRNTWLRVVHKTLERAGPAFIKWGQWAATRPDLFPQDLCTELAKLQTKAPVHRFSYTKKTIEKAFGRKISEIFEEFEEEPVASGSVAQVHRASLRFQYPGQKVKPILVAVKVRHPGVGESIKRDFTIINYVAKISNFVPTLRWLRLDESVQQFAVFMLSQVDLAREAAQLSRFIYNFRRWKDVSFPKPLYPLVHPAVLVETYEHGESVAHYVDELEGNARIKSALAHIGTHALLKMLLVDNFIHADMHPGNILVRVSHSKPPRKRLFKSRPHVVFLDVGMTAELSNSDRVNLLEFFKAVAVRDGRTAAECTLKLSKQQNCPDPKAFIEEVKKSFDFWGTPEGDIVHPAECIQQLLEYVRRHKVNIDGNVCTVLVTTLVLEGWQRKLDPGYNVMQTLHTLLFRADWAESLSYTIEGLMAP
ncbi:probable serine/threonine-protein kinase abkC isoform X1 [Amborella trichopoda]|uniref:probable serine/threonine-protein kinase abkC isoform X1 n=1 Tax=Amborella trichopoda TaxID=13333 RepID=UPI0005D2F548|nr:probable serine/threonine-protein kinase abkC isoform X1 [Amborella trichopoda]|eukprot:XP_011622354.1 probable serine/threonine-protein kinase abkC isoform X1 [Amborella trichopoda]